MTNRNKILQAIAECNRYIALEGARSADLRPADIQKLLDWYIAHRAKLLTMLDKGEELPAASNASHYSA
jgi:hypothetical protein